MDAELVNPANTLYRLSVRPEQFGPVRSFDHLEQRQQRETPWSGYLVRKRCKIWNGVVDAAEGPVSAAFAAKFHEAAKNVIRTDHIYSSAHITINEKAYQELSHELQQILVAAAKEAVAWARDQSSKDTDDALAKMAAAGATLHKIDVSAIQGKSQAAVADMESEGAWSAGLWKAIQEVK